MKANASYNTSWKHSSDRFISGKMPKKVCVILSVCVCICECMCVCLRWKQNAGAKQCFQSVLIFTSSQLHPPSTFHRHCTDVQPIYRMMKARVAFHGLVTSAPLNPACVRLLWLQHPGILLDSDLFQSLDLWYFKFSSLLYIFLSHWCVIYSTTLLHIDGFIWFFSLFSCPLFIVYMPSLYSIWLYSNSTFHLSSTLHHYPALRLHALFPALFSPYTAPMY